MPRPGLTWDVTPSLTAAYTFNLFDNYDHATANSYLRDASGHPVYAGKVAINGETYTPCQQCVRHRGL